MLEYALDEFLLTPLREGRLISGIVFYAEEKISTHAPAGGATEIDMLNLDFDFISTHAPAGGATFGVCLSFGSDVFLLTPLREGRPHALECLFCRALFLLTPLREGRPAAVTPTTAALPFLLTPLREGRHGSGGVMDGYVHFYSRPCGRGDRRSRSRQDSAL